MNIAQTEAPTTRKPLRVWPGVVIATLLLLSMFALPAVAPGAVIYGMLGGAVCALAILVWWVFFSRASWAERLGAIALMAVALFATDAPAAPLPSKTFSSGRRVAGRRPRPA